MADYVYRVEIRGRSGGVTTTFRFATRGYADATNYHDGRVMQPLLIQRHAFGKNAVMGTPQIASGTCVLNNADGALDYMLEYVFESQLFHVYRVDPVTLSERLEFLGVSEQVAGDATTLVVTVRDFLYLLDQKFQPTKYLGNNVLPAGLEGGTDLKDKPKPVLLGKVYNFQPILVNQSRLIYQIHDAAMSANYALTVYDRRVPVAAGTSRTLAELTGASVVQIGDYNDTASNGITIDTTNDVISREFFFGGTWSFTTGDPIYIWSDGAMPGGVSKTTKYFVRISNSDRDMTLHPTAADASANTNKVNITSTVPDNTILTFAKNSTAPGCYDWCNDSTGFYIRMGSQPSFLTSDATYDTTATYWSSIAAQVLSRWNAFATSKGLPNLTLDSRINDSYVCGMFISEEMKYYEVLTEIVARFNASIEQYPNTTATQYVTCRQARRFGLGDTPRVYLTESNIASLRRDIGAGPERGLAPWKVSVNYWKNYTVMNGEDVAGAVSAADRDFVSKEYRTVTDQNTNIQVDSPNAPELPVVNTFATNGIEAAGFANYLITTYGNNSLGVYTVSTSLDDFDELTDSTRGVINGLMLFDCLHVTYPRYGFSGGKFMSTLGYEVDLAKRTIQLTLWG